MKTTKSGLTSTLALIAEIREHTEACNGTIEASKRRIFESWSALSQPIPRLGHQPSLQQRLRR